MPRIPQYNQQTSAPVQYRDPGTIVPGQSGKLLGSIAQTAGNVIDQQRQVTARNQQFMEQAQAESDRETEATQRLQAKEWADRKAADLELRKMDAFNQLQSSIGADQDFAQEWEKTRAQMDDEETKAIPSTNPFYGDQLRGKIEDQRGKYGAQAIAQKYRMAEENAAMNFGNLIDSKRKILMQLPGRASDDKLAEFVAELPENASLAQIEQTKADAMEKRAREDQSETVLQNMVQTADDARLLVSAISGQEIVRYHRRPGFTGGGRSSVRVAGGKWDKQIAAAGEKYGVSSTLISAMMSQESGGAQTDKSGKIITSEKGAMGLLQLMPGTAKEMGVDPSDPAQNIEGGAKYLAQQLEKYGNEPMALAAYNAGPGNVDAAIRKAKEANDAANWMKYLPKPEETTPYVTNILRKANIRGGGGADYEAIREPAATLNVVKTASPEQLAKYLNIANGVIEQDARARTEATKLEVAERERAERAAAADGIRIDRPLTVESYLAAGYNAKDAQIKAMAQAPYQRMAPIVADLKNRSKAERDALVLAAQPKNTGEAGIDYDAKRDAWKVMDAANKEIDRQVAEDPAGYAIRSNPLIAGSWEKWAMIAQNPSASMSGMKAQALDSYVAQVEGFQKSQGIDAPGILPKTQVDAIKAQWYGQEDGPMKAAQTMGSLAQVYGKHYPKILKQLAKDLPSEALWVGNLADDPGTEGVRQQLAAASKVFAKPDAIQGRGAVEKAVDLKFAPFITSMTSTDPAGGADAWNQLRDGAVKLAAFKMAQSGASATDAAKQAYDELVATQFEFVASNRAVTSFLSDGTTLSAVTAPAQIRIPRNWPGKGPGQTAKSVVDGAATWRRNALESLDLLPDGGKSQRVYLADVKSWSGWVTSPDDDGLILMLGSAPVRTRDGKPVKLPWSMAADYQVKEFAAMLAANPKARIGEAIIGTVGGAMKSVGEWFISPSR